jgi:hypothetical protein
MLAGALVLAPMAVTAHPAGAAVTECVGTPPSGTTVPGPMTVPLGEFCSLHQATVLGSVTVYGSLYMNAGNVAGSVSAYDAQVGLVDTQIGNSVVATQPRAKFFLGPAVLLCGSTVTGSVTVRGAAQAGASSIGGPFCDGKGNTVKGGVHLLDNTADHALYVWSTTVGGNLVCRASAGPDLQGNTVSGSILNTCSRTSRRPHPDWPSSNGHDVF